MGEVQNPLGMEDFEMGLRFTCLPSTQKNYYRALNTGRFKAQARFEVLICLETFYDTSMEVLLGYSDRDVFPLYFPPFVGHSREILTSKSFPRLVIADLFLTEMVAVRSSGCEDWTMLFGPSTFFTSVEKSFVHRQDDTLLWVLMACSTHTYGNSHSSLSPFAHHIYNCCEICSKGLQ